MTRFFRSLLATVTLAVVSIHSASAENQTWGEIEKGAKTEGAVILYSTQAGSPAVRKIVANFKETYGINVDILEGNPVEMRERIRVEQSTGRFAADVLLNGSSTTELMMAEGRFEPFGALPNAGLVRSPYTSTPERISINSSLYGLMINTRLVSDADAPKSWRDLLAPRWKGKILSNDMRAAGGGQVLFMSLYDKWGKDFLQQLSKQNITFSREIRNDPGRVARGEYPIYIPQIFPYYLPMAQLPVRFIVPEEGAPYISFEMTMLKHPPHPNAARLLINFFLDPKSQYEFGKIGFNPVVDDAYKMLDPALAKQLNVPLMGTSDAGRIDEMTRLATEIFGK